MSVEQEHMHATPTTVSGPDDATAATSKSGVRPLVTDTAATPHVALRAVPAGDVRWTQGFWADRFKLCRETMVPVMRGLMEGTERTHFYQNLRIAAGEVEGKHRGARWNDGDFYKWLEAAIVVNATAREPELETAIDGMIATIARAQRADGYLHSPQIINWRSGGDLPAFADPMHFEMYNMGHLITTAVVHHRATGKDTLLNVAMKAADHLDRAFSNPTPERARHGICPSHLMALVELYRETRHKPYLDLAVRLLAMRDLVVNGDDDNQDRVPFRKQTTAHGHAVRATYLYASAADIYAETGDPTLMAPMKAIWRDLVEKKLYITGGCGALFDGASPDGSADQASITRVHQAFGRNYQLPQSTAHNETCAAIGNVMWNWRMLQITGEAKYADVLEQTLYNSVLSGVSLDGTRFFYTNTLRNERPMPVELRWNRTRQRFIGCFCCPPNVVRTVAEASNYAYLRSDDGVTVVLYGSSALDTRLAGGAHVRLRQETEYPWDGRVRLTVDSAGEFAVTVRVPEWTRGATLAVNGKGWDAFDGAAGFFAVRRAWKAGDVVELNLPMPARLVEANPYVEEARNHAAVVRGPIVYCLESPDLPEGTRVRDVRLLADAEVRSAGAHGALPGVVALRAKGNVVDDGGDWDGRLYRDLPRRAARPVELTLVPYFAWDNRGESEMTVWIPLA